MKYFKILVLIFLLVLGTSLIVDRAIPSEHEENFINRPHLGDVVACDTQEQMLNLVGWRFSKKLDDDAAMKMVNGPAGAAVCGIMRVAFFPQERVDDFFIDNLRIQVYRVLVFKIFDPETNIPVPLPGVLEQYVVHVESSESI